MFSFVFQQAPGAGGITGTPGYSWSCRPVSTGRSVLLLLVPGTTGIGGAVVGGR